MATEIDMAAGGTAVVILAKAYELDAEYAVNPQIVPVKANELSGDPEKVSLKLPANAKVAIISDGIPSNYYGALLTACRKRGLVYLMRRNQAAIDEQLAALFPKKRNALPFPVATLADAVAATNGNGHGAAAEKPQAFGTVSAFVEAEADLRKAAAEEARRLLPIAASRGIQTTFLSLSQQIGKLKRKHQATGVPASIQSKQAQALTILDQAIDSLRLIRDYVASTETENSALTDRLKAIEEAFRR